MSTGAGPPAPTNPGGGQNRTPPGEQMSPETLELFYDEAKAEADGLLDTVKNYRSSSTTVLALATGAAAFFGFEDSAKGGWYAVALVFYAVAALLAVLIHQPRGWRQGAVVGLDRVLASPNPGISVDQARFDLGRLHVKHFEANLERVGRVAALFKYLLAATALVIICAGINATVEKPDAPEKPTRVIIEEAE